MYKYQKMLAYPINVKKKDLKMAKYIITQLGGPAGEMGAALRYFCHQFSMPDEKGKELMNTIATEELGHIEMIATIVHQLTKDATIDEIKQYGLSSLYTEHGKGIYPSDSFGNAFTASYIASSGDYLTDISEDMAAEMKAKSTYEHLIDLTDDESLIAPLLFLRQREIVHFQRFKELFEYYKKMDS